MVGMQMVSEGIPPPLDTSLTKNPNLKIVGFLDVLGFENRLRTLGLSNIQAKYKNLIDYVKSQTGGVDIVPTLDGHVAVGWLALGNAYFSDTLLFWTNYSELAVPGFSNLIADAICFGIEIELPLRGAIAVGHAVLDSDEGIYIGYPLVEAARTETAQRWIGASFGPSFSSPNFNKGFHLHTILPYKSHYKQVDNKHATGMTIDWPRHWRETRKTKIVPLITAMDSEPDFSDYYTNTLNFTQFSERNHDWFKKGGKLSYG